MPLLGGNWAEMFTSPSVTAFSFLSTGQKLRERSEFSQLGWWFVAALRCYWAEGVGVDSGQGHFLFMFSVLNNFGPVYSNVTFCSHSLCWIILDQCTTTFRDLFVFRITESHVSCFCAWKAPFANRLDFLNWPKNIKRKGAQNRTSNELVSVNWTLILNSMSGVMGLFLFTALHLTLPVPFKVEEICQLSFRGLTTLPPSVLFCLRLADWWGLQPLGNCNCFLARQCWWDA